MAHVVDQLSLGAIVQVRDRLLAQQARGRKVFRLESGDPSFDIPEWVREAMERALREGLTHYTPSTGILPLREAILEKVREENGLRIPDPEHIVVTNGGMHGLYILFRAIIEPGDEVILPDPMWTEIAEHIRLSGGVPIAVRLRPEEGYRYAPEAIAEAITPRTRAIFVNTPHNPTGAVLPREALEGIARLAEEHDLLLVSDEAYEHIIFDGLEHVSIGSLPGARERTLSVFSLSKSYAMSGLRLGYVAVPGLQGKILERLKKLVRCTINGVNSVAQYGALAALTGPQDYTRAMAAEYQHRRNLLLAGVERAPYLEPFKPSGAFYLWAKIVGWPGYQGRRDDWSLTEYLIDRAGIGSSPGSAFGPAGEGHIRFAFSCATEQVEEAAQLLPEVLQAAGGEGSG